MSDQPQEATVLKPCPFCGGEAECGLAGPGHFVECEECDSGTAFCHARQDAIAAWNRRAGEREDDGEAVTVEWLEVVARSAYQLWASLGKGIDVFWIDGPIEWRCGTHKIPAPATRADVRRLCACLGIVLKEQSDE